MDNHTATEQAYKNGYENGKKDAKRWIPVSVMLPENGQEVLAYKQGRFVVSRYMEYDILGKMVGTFGGVRDLASHWMPLPKPPKEE